MTPEDIELIRGIFREEIQQAINTLTRNPTPVNREWYDVKDALETLGISPDYFRDLVKRGFFRPEIDFRDIRSPGSAKPKYQFHKDNCQKKLSQDPAKRKVYSIKKPQNA
jgi:hypothetical protein